MTSSQPAIALPRIEFIGLIAAIMALNALAIDVMLPAFPDIGSALGVVEENDMQFVLTIYLLGFGISQIIYGPLSDRFGRRGPLLIGIGIYMAAAFLAPLSPNYATLLALRFIQGIGAASSRVIAQSIVRDTFSGRGMAEIMSLVFMIFMIIPIVAPGVGQILLLAGHWSFIFIFMGLLGAVIGTWIFFRLPETLKPEDQRALKPQIILDGFRIVFSNRVAMLYASAGIFVFAALNGYINSAQQIYVDIYDLGAMFPFAFGTVGVVMAVSNFANSRMVGRIGMRRLSHYALLAYIFFASILFVISLFGTPPLWVFLTLFALVMFHFGWIGGNMNALSMEPLGRVAGTASSVFGFIQTIGGALLGLAISQSFNGTTTPVIGGYALMGLLALSCVLLAEKGKLFGVGDDNRPDKEPARK